MRIIENMTQEPVATTIHRLKQAHGAVSIPFLMRHLKLSASTIEKLLATLHIDPKIAPIHKQKRRTNAEMAASRLQNV